MRRGREEDIFAAMVKCCGLWWLVLTSPRVKIACGVMRVHVVRLQRIFAPVFVVVMFMIFYLGIISRNGGSNSSSYWFSTRYLPILSPI